jgi:hypothetical protein
MKKLAFGALLVGLLAACGGGDKKNTVVVVDSGGPDGPTVCNPLTQAGCAANEKCTWLLDAVMPQYVGHIGCAPDGTAAVGAACMYGAPGATGFDNCAKGSVCGNYRGGAGTCKQICDQQGGMPACDAQHVCVTYAGLFSTGSMTPAAGGVCDLACDPMTDNDYDGSGAGVKTTMTCGANAAVGCYGYPSGGTPPATGWSCTSDINAAEAQPIGLRHRVQCTETNKCAAAGPTIYVNSCNQGYLPLLDESTTVTTTICTALCKPQNCYGGACGNGANRVGVMPHRCQGPDRVGSFDNANDADGGEHCAFIWYFETVQGSNPIAILRSPTSDTVGFCFDHGKYQYDSNNDNMPDKALPNCNMLATAGFSTATDPTNPLTYFGAADLGCVDTATAGIAAQGKAMLPESAGRKRAVIDMPRLPYNRTMGLR